MTLLDEPVIVVMQQSTFFSQRADYQLFRPDATPIGAVTEERGRGNFLGRQLGTLRFVVTDSTGATVAVIDKPGSFGRSTFLVYDDAGTQVGEIGQRNLMFAPQFDITTAGRAYRLTSAAVMAWDWLLDDESGAAVGSITREFAGLADAFTDVERFVVQLSDALTGPDRLAALASCVCLDVVRDLKAQNRRPASP